MIRLVSGMLGLGLMLLASGCLVKNSGVVLKATFQNQNCMNPDALDTSKISRRMLASGVRVEEGFCSRSEGYSCYRRVFSPNIQDGESLEQECATLSEMGGEFCLRLSSRSFNTREAASAPDVSPAALLPGGDYNRVEYVCHQMDFQDGEQFLALGEADTLSGAVRAAYENCEAEAPRFSSPK